MDEGWHPDPERAGVERWWDGLAWTDFTRDAAPPPRPVSRRIPVREQVYRPPDADTRAVAWIAWSPGWVTFALLPLMLVGLVGGAAVMLVPAAVCVSFIALVLLAMRDARELFHRGFPRRPSPVWILLGPLGYLVARWRALGEGRTPLVLCIVQLVIIGGGVFLFQGITLGLQALSPRLG